MSKILLIVVHGTFVRRVPFEKPDHPMIRAITLAVPEGDVEVEPFYWPGAFGTILNNGHRSRLIAGARLAGVLEARHHQEPTRSIFVISHSHGGNVALYAAASIRDKVPLRGIATLSTPFIRSSKRRYTERLDSLRTCGCGCLAIGGLVVLYLAYAALGVSPSVAYMPPELVKKLPHNPMAEKVFVEVGGLYVVVLVAFFCFLSYVQRRYCQSSEPLELLIKEPTIQIPCLPDETLYIAGTAWDEPAAWIAFFDFIATIPRILNSRITITLIYISVALAYWGRLKESVAPLEFRDVTTWFHPLAVLMAVVAGPALAIYVVPALVAVAARTFAYGFEGPVHAALYDVWAARTPRDIYRWRGYVAEGRVLVHSRLYEDPNVHEDLATWISSRESGNVSS